MYVYAMHMFSERLQILVSKEQRRRLEEAARQRKASVASVIRDAVDAELGRGSREDRLGAVAAIAAMRGVPDISPEELELAIDGVPRRRDRARSPRSARAVTFFVDANAIIYSAVEGPGRDACLRVLRAIASGEAEGRTSPAVLEEVWHVAERRYPGRLDGLVENALAIFSPLLPVAEESLTHALALGESQLGPNDRLHLGTCAANGIEVVLTADRAFDAATGFSRVDPLDADAVGRLLAV